MLTEMELKEKLIAKISDTDDVELLQHISGLMDIDQEMIHKMSPEEAAAVAEGLAQLERGEFLSHEESNKRAEEWLKKYNGQ